MENVFRLRRPVKYQYEKRLSELETALGAEKPEPQDIKVKFKLLSDVYDALQAHDNQVMIKMATENLPENEENAEVDAMMALRKKFEEIRAKVDHIIVDKNSAAGSVSGRESWDPTKQRNFKLPPIKMPKFSGQLTDWLAWWAQFQKIDEDQFMNGSDKFWYLLQSLEPGTDAYQIASGYPQSNENYSKVIEALKKRYGNEDLLLQVYVRKLLNLIISNVKSKDKVPLNTLYIQLDSHLRALKTLNLEKADPATWLFPLVESSLPERVLDNWQRSNLSSVDAKEKDPTKTRLDMLMSFLEKEVGIKQHIEVVKTSSVAFAVDQDRAGGYSQDRRHEHRTIKTGQRTFEKRPPVPTLGSFYNNDKEECAFCGKQNHSTVKCYRGKDMSYDQRMEILKNKGLCYRCCGHHTSRDCKSKHLECEICRRQHSTIMCRDLKKDRGWNNQRGGPPAKRLKTEKGPGDAPAVEVRGSQACIGSADNVSFQTLKVAVGNGRKYQIMRALIDSACDRSYITRRAAQRLSLKSSGSIRSIHNVFGGKQSETFTHQKYTVELKSLEGPFCLQDVHVREQETICRGVPNLLLQMPEVKEELNKMNITLSDDSNSDVDFLIGGNLYPYIMTGEFFLLSSGAAAIKTRLGWTVLGELDNCSGVEENVSSACISMTVNDNRITTLWELETIGIREPSEQKEIQKKVELAKEKYVSSISRGPDGRYIAKLPWKDEMPPLPSNREVAYKRLQSATRKLEETSMFEAYNKIFKDWESWGFIEKVPIPDNTQRVHYLPHRPVIKKESLTTPVRPVFDASCRVGKAPSLNDCLFTGENYVQKILDILLRFREKPVAFVADIKKAFQMIGLEEGDRDSVRFLWWTSAEKTEIIEYRHARVVFGVTCSPFILACVLHHHLESLPEEEISFGQQLLSTLYVDNCVHSTNTIEEYEVFKLKAVEVMKEASMDLRMWQSNVEETEDEITKIVSVLGLLWDRNEDSLSINLKSFTVPEKVTKRSILSTIQKIYDPIGFTSPGLLLMKVLLQRTWQRKLKWDEELSENESKSFLRWCSEAVDFGKIQLPRLSTNGSHTRKNWTLHIFCDASRIAYSGTVFLRADGEEETTVQLLCAKSRVAPVKEMTIPKLELMASLLGVRLFNTVVAALSAEEIPAYFYSDSTTVLAWITRNDQWGTFVANRVKEILCTTKAEQWRHVPGESNPAELPSRGCFPSQLLNSNWWCGPAWLYEEEPKWPKSAGEINEEEVLSERKKTSTVQSFLVQERIQNTHSFGKMVRIVGWVRRFLFNKHVNSEKRRSGPLSTEELKRAEIVFVKDIQREEFSKENLSKLAGLEYFEDEWGVLRVRTRLTYRTDLGNYRYPILLPHNRPEVKQLIKDYHEKYYHAGVSYLLPLLRNKFWITKARHTVRSVLFKCVRCKRYSTKPIVPKPAPLPLDRVKDAEVFEVVGVDLAGPLLLRNGKKAWLVIFTCSVYRAVHFEVVSSLTAKAFIKSLEVFTEKYRRPAIIYSDNGTNFRGTQKLFSQIDWDEVAKDEKMTAIEWKFNPATSSWWGGFWERLIRVAKDLLRRTVGRKTLNWNELKTAVNQIRDVMNARPLTYMSEDNSDLEPLTPALFLHPFGHAKLPEREITESDKLRLRYKYMQTLKRELKGRFLKEYLAMLVNRRTGKPTRELREGEMVLVGSDNTKRLTWPLGRVLKTKAGGDGVHRVAQVKTQNGVIWRSVQRLYPLEVDDATEIEEIVQHNKVSGRRDQHNEVSGIRDQHNEVSGIRDQHNEVSGIRDQHNEVSGIRDQHEEVSGINDQYNEIFESRPLHSEVFGRRPLHNEVYEGNIQLTGESGKSDREMEVSGRSIQNSNSGKINLDKGVHNGARDGVSTRSGRKVQRPKKFQ